MAGLGYVRPSQKLTNGMWSADCVIVFFLKRKLSSPLPLPWRAVILLMFSLLTSGWLHGLWPMLGYKLVCSSYLITSGDRYCGGRLEKPSGSFKTPNWPDRDYPIGVTCVWHIVAPKNQVRWGSRKCGESEYVWTAPVWAPASGIRELKTQARKAQGNTSTYPYEDPG